MENRYGYNNLTISVDSDGVLSATAREIYEAAINGVAGG